MPKTWRPDPAWWDTELVRRLMSLPPDSQLLIERTLDDVPATSRFLKLEMTANTAEIHWANYKVPVGSVPFSPVPHSPNPFRSLHEIDPPIIAYTGRGRKRWPPIWNHGSVYFVSDAILGCLLDLDPDGIEYRAVTLIGVNDPRSYFAVFPLRRIDPVDLPRTTTSLVSPPMSADGFCYRRAHFPEEYTVRDDISAEVHIFKPLFGAHLLVSVELLALMRSRGVTAITAYRTEGLWGGGRAPPKSTIKF